MNRRDMLNKPCSQVRRNLDGSFDITYCFIVLPIEDYANLWRDIGGEG
jgi:hypothetical protein